MTQRLKNKYVQTIVPKLIETFKYKNKHQVPKIEKIIINRGLGDASQNNKILESEQLYFFSRKKCVKIK